MILHHDKFVAPGHRFAWPLNLRPGPETATMFKLSYLSPDSFRLRSRPVGSDRPIGIRLSFGETAVVAEGLSELVARAEFVGEKGRVQVPVKSASFIEDAARVRKFVIAVAARLLGGGEPCSYDRRGGTFNYYFSSDPIKSLQRLLDGFILPHRQGWENSGRVFLFYPEGPSYQGRELGIFDAWIVNRIAEMELARDVIDPLAIANQAGVTEKRVIARFDQINDARRAWGLSPCPGTRASPR